MKMDTIEDGYILAQASGMLVLHLISFSTLFVVVASPFASIGAGVCRTSSEGGTPFSRVTATASECQTMCESISYCNAFETWVGLTDNCELHHENIVYAICNSEYACWTKTDTCGATSYCSSLACTCVDSSNTGYNYNGAGLSCAQLAGWGLCYHGHYGPGVRSVCPNSCGVCSYQPPSYWSCSQCQLATGAPTLPPTRIPSLNPTKSPTQAPTMGPTAPRTESPT